MTLYTDLCDEESVDTVTLSYCNMVKLQLSVQVEGIDLSGRREALHDKNK